MFGVRPLHADDPCGAGEAQRSRSAGSGGGSNVDISLPTPRNPIQRTGGQSGSGQGSGGSGGGSPLAGSSPPDPSGGSSSPGARGQAGGGDGNSEQGAPGGSSPAEGQGEGSGGEGEGRGASGAEAGEGGEGGSSRAGSAEASEAAATAAGEAEDGGEGSGSGGSGGYGIADAAVPPGPNLAGIGRETVRMSERYDRSGSLRVMPWRLRDDEGMLTASSTRVLYADNARALQRFQQDDLFITLTPAEVEAQRRMLEADAFPIFQAEAGCDSPNLPPRRVFRRVATADPGFRYVYCDQDESMVIFRQRSDANAYASLSAPDRPLYLARLASDRLASFERSEEIARLRAFVDDPNVLREYSRDEIYGMVKAAGDLLVFQNTLESALVQSMTELGPSGISSYYYEMHRQVLQAPFFITMAESVYRLNLRLASDPLQSLAWANAQPELAREGFFNLYHSLGGMMEWPERWATLQRRYGSAPGSAPARDPDAPSLDFLQILSDPSRVRVDWHAERTGNPSIRDRQMQEGRERTTEERAVPSAAEQLERQDETEHRRGGTGGLGRAGEGESSGPESGRQPMQMILVRIVPDTGDPDRPRIPQENQRHPGGTEGQKRRQTEESATRQEPLLWVSPQTFVQAILSTWDGRDLHPTTAGRVPPVLRFNDRLRELFLRELRPSGVYDNRLRTAMEVFTRGGWLRYAEVREAMGGSFVNVKAHDTGRFSGAYSGNPPINDQDQIRIPNFFMSGGVVIPADLYDPVREHYTRSIFEIFDLAREPRTSEPTPLRTLAVEPAESAQQARSTLLRSLELVRQQADEQD
jgi:hypothetical protein